MRKEYKIIYSLLILLLYYPIHAQRLLNLGSIDFIGYCQGATGCIHYSGQYTIGQLYYYKKQADGYYQIYRTHLSYGGSRGPKFTLDTIDKVGAREHNYQNIYTSSLKKLSLQQFKKKLSQSEFYHTSRRDDVVTEEHLQVINNHVLMKQTITITARDNGILDTTQESYLVNYYIVQLGKGKYMLLSTDDTHISFYKNGQPLVLEIFEDSLRKYKVRNAGSPWQHVTELDMLSRNDINYQTKENIDSSYSLVDGYNYEVLPQTFDRIDFAKNKIIGYKDKRIFVYNNFGQSITKEAPVRAFQDLDAKRIAVLQQNEVRILDLKGDATREVLDSKYFEVHRISNDVVADDIIKLSHLDRHVEDRNRTEYYKVDSLPNGASLYFLNNKKTDPYSIINGVGNFLVKQEDKYRLATLMQISIDKSRVPDTTAYSVNKTYYLRGKVQYRTPIAYDSIKVMRNEQEPVIILYKSNAVGIFGMEDEEGEQAMPFKNILPPIGGFMRVTFLDGRLGWIVRENYNYKVYLDE